MFFTPLAMIILIAVSFIITFLFTFFTGWLLDSPRCLDRKTSLAKLFEKYTWTHFKPKKILGILIDAAFCFTIHFFFCFVLSCVIYCYASHNYYIYTAEIKSEIVPVTQIEDYNGIYQIVKFKNETYNVNTEFGRVFHKNAKFKIFYYTKGKSLGLKFPQNYIRKELIISE